MLPNILWVTKQHTVNWIQIGRGGAYSWGIIIRCIIYFVDGTFTGGGGLQWQCMVVEISWNKFK